MNARLNLDRMPDSELCYTLVSMSQTTMTYINFCFLLTGVVLILLRGDAGTNNNFAVLNARSHAGLRIRPVQSTAF